jgi:hypothetical protein
MAAFCSVVRNLLFAVIRLESRTLVGVGLFLIEKLFIVCTVDLKVLVLEMSEKLLIKHHCKPVNLLIYTS